CHYYRRATSPGSSASASARSSAVTFRLRSSPRSPTSSLNKIWSTSNDSSSSSSLSSSSPNPNPKLLLPPAAPLPLPASPPLLTLASPRLDCGDAANPPTAVADACRAASAVEFRGPPPTPPSTPSEAPRFFPRGRGGRH
ncbi:unnamed protein product, partial [Ectocarpus sp. 12 AP-2014]